MKVCIGLSGGVDSSVAALLLKQQGYDVFAMFMQNWHDTEGTLHGDCEWEEDRFVAEMVARKIGIPFYFIDLSKEYRQRVVDYMFDEYSKGRTPNPDVLCNREIKFAAFLDAARKLGADMVATGHYCRKEEARDAEGNVLVRDGKPVYRILAGADPNKDQSYFLCQLTQEQLSMAMFPIGDICKPEVRRLAKEADLPSAEKKDSQGICFVGKVDLPVFLQQKLKSVEGDVVEVYDAFYEDNAHYRFLRETLSSILADDWKGELSMVSDYISDDKAAKSEAGEYEGGCRYESVYDPKRIGALDDDTLMRLSMPVTYETIKFETETYRSGKKHVKKTRYKANPYGAVIGRHEGAQFYTIGQRKGLNIGGHKESLFVISTDIEQNIIYVGEGHHHRGLSRSCLRVAPEEIHWIREDLALGVGENRRCRVRIRYRQPLQDAVLIMRRNGLFILFEEPQRGITPGQFAVWYDRDEMLGSGVI
ncbi:MAG: tRNA 2-thiouridine(34) synthase MnmA [Candidatus Cryptobacteroides sp.]|nr:tRNA 2-thiouridine(34) synthase MnmA [Candidatus Cryptobacteroides sp.]